MAEEGSDWPEFAFRCNGGGGCVIVQHVAGAVVIRDSKNPQQAGLVFSRKEYAEFRRRVQGGSWSHTVLQFVASALRSAATIMRHGIG